MAEREVKNKEKRFQKGISSSELLSVLCACRASLSRYLPPESRPSLLSSSQEAEWLKEGLLIVHHGERTIKRLKNSERYIG